MAFDKKGTLILNGVSYSGSGSSGGEGGASTWNELSGKPFNTIGAGLTVEDDVLKTTGGGGGGVSTYAELPDKPQINDIELSGNKTLEDLNIQEKITHDQPISDSYVFHDRTSVNNVISQMDSDITALKNDVQVLQITVGQANALLEEVLYGNS